MDDDFVFQRRLKNGVDVLLLKLPIYGGYEES